jgi:hypothetical protein
MRKQFNHEDHPAVAALIAYSYCEGGTGTPLTDEEASNGGALEDAIEVCAKLPRDRRYACYTMGTDDPRFPETEDMLAYLKSLGPQVSEQSFPGSVFAQWLTCREGGCYFTSADYNVGGADMWVFPEK